MAKARLPSTCENVASSAPRTWRPLLSLDEIEALDAFPRVSYREPRAMAALWAATDARRALPADASNEDPCLLIADRSGRLYLSGPMSRLATFNCELTILASVAPSTDVVRVAGRILGLAPAVNSGKTALVA